MDWQGGEGGCAFDEQRNGGGRGMYCMYMYVHVLTENAICDVN